MDGGRAAAGKRGAVLGTGVPLVALEVVRREGFRLDAHHPVPGHLGHHRGRRDGQTRGVAADHGAHLSHTGGVAHKIPTAVNEYQVGDHTECKQRPLGT